MTKNRVLFMTPHAPNQNGTGAERRAWGHLNSLARNHYVIMAFVDFGQLKNIETLRQSERLCHETIILSCVKTSHPSPRDIPGVNLLNAIWRYHKPDEILDAGSQARLKKLIRNTPPVLVFCFRCDTANIWALHGYHQLLHQTATVIDFDDIESIAFARHLQVDRETLGFEIGLITRLNIFRQKRAEGRLLRQATAVLVCSDHDRDVLLARDPGANVLVIPNSIPLPSASPARTTIKLAEILFVGTMSYPPNENAMIYFCREILPRIRKEWECGVSLKIVGFRPPQSVRELEEIDDVHVTGGVDSVDPYYEDADIVICPIRFGGGTRIKILEAMGFVRPVVSTTIGAEGLDVEDGRNILIGDTPDEFADACLRLLKDPQLRVSIADAGRELVENKYAAETVQNDLSATINGLIELFRVEA